MIAWLASLFVLSVALRQMEHLSPCATGMSWNQRVSEALLGLAWIALGLGAFINVAKPFSVPIQSSDFYDTMQIIGVALVLLIREVRHAGNR